jgi:predicted dehydrogenase
MEKWPMPAENRIRVAIIGAGKFGIRRATAIAANPHSTIDVVADQVPEAARRLAGTIGCSHSANWEETVMRDDIDAVVVSTSTRFLPVVTQKALAAGKHVLCEKPFGRCVAEVLPAVEEAATRNLRLKVGYNHRYHPAIAKAHALHAEGAIGRILFLRCLYGHGGRPGYEREWRTQNSLSGGGELLDQGVHALDLFQWFAGSFQEAIGFVTTAFWPIAPCEDNAFALLRTAGGCVAQLHASWTNWRNVFVFEVFGESGSLAVSGLGGNYGPERLCFAARRASGAPPEEQWFEFPGEDRSLEYEWSDFLQCIAEGQEPPSSGRQALQTLQLVEAIYKSDPNGCATRAASMATGVAGRVG